MSGLEVAGVVLGALPLVIYACEQLRDGPLGRFSNFQKELKKILDDVKLEELLYRLLLKRLLRPLVCDGSLAEDEVEQLASEADTDLWEDPLVDNALKKRLGEAYDLFLDNVKEVQTLLWDVLGPLVKEPDFNIVSEEAQMPLSKRRLITKAYVRLVTTCKHGHERFKFVCKDRHRNELLRNIHRKLGILERILEGSEEIIKVGPTSKEAPSLRVVNNLVGYWRHADRIYTLLVSSWGCLCKQNHCAHLWLQHRTSPSFDLRMLILFAPQGCAVSGDPPWRQNGIQIDWSSPSTSNVTEQKIAPSLPVPSQIQTHPMTVTEKCRRFGRASKKGKEKVPINAPCRTDHNPGVTSSLSLSGRVNVTLLAASTSTISNNAGPSSKKLKSSTPTDQKTPRPVTQDVIKNLCSTMEHCGMQQSGPLGILIDDTQGVQYRVSSQPEQKLIASETSLSAILHPDHRPRLTRVQRLQIALKLASSHLQLRSTPWARNQWESDDIRFPQTDPSDASSVLLDRPFVAADFKPEMPLRAHAPQPTDKSFACLGIMLLELAFGKRLEEHELWQKMGGRWDKNDPGFRLIVARNWQQEVRGEAGEKYFSAVAWCLDKSPPTLDGDEWRENLASEVVLLLQKSCEWIS